MDTPPAKPRVIDRLFGPSPRESQLEDELKQWDTTFENIRLRMENLDIERGDGGRVSMHEALLNIDMMIDAQGWTNIFEYDEDSGLTLRQVKEAAKQLRELLVGNPHIGNGLRIRSGHTWGGGLDFSIRNKTGKQTIRSMPGNMQDLMAEPWAQRYLFGKKAQIEWERAAYTDGQMFLLGRDSDKRVQRVQLQEIKGALHNPNNTEEIWAYRRVWTPNFQDPTEQREQRVRWYYTDLFPRADRRSRIKTRDGSFETAEVGYTLLDFTFNRQIGWAFGVPDALCVLAWAKLYKEFLVNGHVMSRSLAKLAFRLTVASTTAGQRAAEEISQPGQAGSTHIEGDGNKLEAMSSAGKGYDFASGQPILAAVAAGLGVSALALSSNPADASGSAAAATSLDPIARATAAVRRGEWEDELARLFKFFGLAQPLVVTWHDLLEDTQQRQMQAWVNAANTGLFGPEIMQSGIAKVVGIASPGDIPDGYLQPNNRASLPRKDIDTDSTGGPNAKPVGGSNPSSGSGQGTKNPAGKTPDDHDDDET